MYGLMDRPPSDTTSSPSWPTLVVAMATFRRPDCVDRILPELVRQVTAYPGSASVVVVDNDPEAGAREQVTAWRQEPVRYVHEPAAGIAAARNRALAEAGDAEVLLFVDDDELPLERWVDRMVGSWRQWRCAGVAGPVLARYESVQPDEWIQGSGVFDRRQLPTGTVVAGAGSGNLLLHLPTLASYDLRFDEEFGLSGGSDTMLTRDLSRRGGVIRWCDEAEVYDYQSPDRVSRRWVLRRSFRTGNDWSRVMLALTKGPAATLAQRLELTARGLYRAVGGVATRVRGQLGSDVPAQARGACMVATGLGTVTGAWGVVWVEYGRKPQR
ncbi:MAG: hypothetical protein JWP61_2577 [Friedmanniella sp.]|nr:hypothetical protein [Friedmanniella sp.]